MHSAKCARACWRSADGNFVTLVAPVSHGCGGSFVARNLAAAFAFDEAKTALLIDCDLRHPAQHATLGVDPSEGGLIDYLEDPDARRRRTCSTTPAFRACA